MSFIPNNESDKVTFYFNPLTAKPFIGWARFFGIMSILSGAFYCISLIMIPAGIFCIIASIKLLNACKDVSAVIETGNPAYSEYAGENLYKAFQGFFRYYLTNIIMVVLTIVIATVLIIVFAEDIAEIFKKLISQMEDGNDFADLMISFKALF